MRVCRSCDEVRPADDFHPTSLCCKRCVRARAKESRQIALRRRGTEGTGPRALPESSMSGAERSAYWATFKRRQGCADCGSTEWRSLEFDHLPGHEKLFTISEAVKLTGRYSDEDIAAEVAKCEVVCRDCHLQRTSKRGPRNTPRTRDAYQLAWGEDHR